MNEVRCTRPLANRVANLMAQQARNDTPRGERAESPHPAVQGRLDATYDYSRILRDRHAAYAAEQSWERGGIPARHRAAVDLADRSSGPWRARAREITEGVLAGRGAIYAILGERGRGKTQMAALIARDVTRAGRAVRYGTAADVIADAIDAVGHPGRQLSAYVTGLAKVGVLFVDELHVRKGGDFDDRLLTDVVDRRYREMRPTVLISNEKPAAFVDSIGESVVDRIRETGGIVECDWPSFRERP